VPVILVTAAMITPPDPVTMLAAALPLWLLFEAAVLVYRMTARLGGRRR